MKALPLTARELKAVEPFIQEECGGAEGLVKKQSFHIEQKDSPLNGALFLSLSCGESGGSVSFGFFREGRAFQRMPDHPAEEWETYRIEAVSFTDVNEDGRFDIVAMVSAMTGTGPTGSKPFNVPAVWFQDPQGQFAPDPKADELLKEHYSPTVKKTLTVLKKLYSKK